MTESTPTRAGALYLALAGALARQATIDRIQAAAETAGALVDVHRTTRFFRVVVTGTYTAISKVQGLLPADVTARARLMLDDPSASLCWLL